MPFGIVARAGALLPATAGGFSWWLCQSVRVDGSACSVFKVRAGCNPLCVAGGVPSCACRLWDRLASLLGGWCPSRSGRPVGRWARVRGPLSNANVTRGAPIVKRFFAKNFRGSLLPPTGVKKFKKTCFPAEMVRAFCFRRAARTIPADDPRRRLAGSLGAVSLAPAVIGFARRAACMIPADDPAGTVPAFSFTGGRSRRAGSIAFGLDDPGGLAAMACGDICGGRRRGLGAATAGGSLGLWRRFRHFRQIGGRGRKYINPGETRPRA